MSIQIADPGRSRRGGLLLLAALALVASSRAEAGRPDPAPARPAVRLVPAPPGDDSTKEGKAALADAAAAKRAAQKLDGTARTQALATLADRYVELTGKDAFAAGERAEAAFRAGELLRSLERGKQADELFARAVELGEEAPSGREFAARSLLERGHIRRRANDAEGALALYAEVQRRFADQRRTAATARTWSGKVQLKAGHVEEATAFLLGFAETYPEFAVEAVRDADLLAVAQAEGGDETAARATVDRLRREVQPVLEKGGKDATAVQAALDDLRVTEMLAGY
jgi:tetratricopeptide (TPR) repeat protein